MNGIKSGLWIMSAGLMLAAGGAAAQDPPPAAGPVSPPAVKPAAQVPAKSSALSDAGEPRANTSGPAAEPVAATQAAPARKAAGGRAAATAARTPAAADRVELGTATVTGDREQPKVMYIVPWKRSDIGDLSGKPMNSLLDEALAPVDRDEFKREVAYYDAVKSDAPQNGARPGAAQGEK